jgi:hypothetical protein
MISSKVTGSEEQGGWRSSGLEATAQASDAHEDKIARRSARLIRVSATTWAGRA